MRALVCSLIITAAGCCIPISPPSNELKNPFEGSGKSLREAREGFVTNLVREGEDAGPPEAPPEDEFELIHYESPVGELAAYVTPDPGDGEQHAAIVWITGGDHNSIGDVWSPYPRSNDQSASAFRKSGMVMMFPSQRGGNDNPGRREGFLGEVDDILAATDYLAERPYVDPERVYLGGHSTGGTMAMLVGACTDRYAAIFALGPVALASDYGGRFVYCDPTDETEMALRSPLYWLQDVQCPMYVFEGELEGNWDSIQVMADANKNPQVQFFPIRHHGHFTVIAPLTEVLAAGINKGELDLSKRTLGNLR